MAAIRLLAQAAKTCNRPDGAFSRLRNRLAYLPRSANPVNFVAPRRPNGRISDGSRRANYHYHMARFNYGGLVTGGTGRFNGNFGGQVLQKNGRSRAYVTPVNPQTSYQVAQRNLMTTLTQSWTGTLTDAQRLAWNSAAQSGNWPITDPFTGSSRNPTSGFELYIWLNRIIDQVAGTRISAVPTKQASGTTVSAAVTAVASTGVITVNYTGTLGTNERHVVKMASPVSAGRTVIRPSLLRFVFQNAAATPITVTSAYATRFGAITGTAGQVIFWQLWAYNSVTGQSRLAGTGRTIIT